MGRLHLMHRPRHTLMLPGVCHIWLALKPSTYMHSSRQHHASLLASEQLPPHGSTTYEARRTSLTSLELDAHLWEADPGRGLPVLPHLGVLEG